MNFIHEVVVEALSQAIDEAAKRDGFVNLEYMTSVTQELSFPMSALAEVIANKIAGGEYELVEGCLVLTSVITEFFESGTAMLCLSMKVAIGNALSEFGKPVPESLLRRYFVVRQKIDPIIYESVIETMVEIGEIESKGGYLTKL